MQRALDTHDTVLRALLARYYGYEVTTEGDSFTMAFHDPVDAVSTSSCATAARVQAVFGAASLPLLSMHRHYSAQLCA